MIDAPAVTHARPVDVVDAGERAVLHREGEAGLGVETERQAERGADRAAMRDGDDVAAAMLLEQRDGSRAPTRAIISTKLSPPGTRSCAGACQKR